MNVKESSLKDQLADLLGVVEIPQIKIDVEPNYCAFVMSGKEMATWDRAVHVHFYDVYFPKYKGTIEHNLHKIVVREGGGDMALLPLAGMLRDTLPKMYVPDHPGDFYEKKARVLCSALVLHCVMDANTVPSKVIHQPNQYGKWETKTLLTFDGDGDKRKSFLKGLHFISNQFRQTKNGRWDLRHVDKRRGKRQACIPWELSDIASEDLFNFLYTLKTDWNKRHDQHGRQIREDFNTKVERYEGYAKTLMSLRGSTFYLEPCIYPSGRQGYVFQGEGMRPQGKAYEPLMIDSAVGYHLGEEQQFALKHVIMCTLRGRMVVSQAVKDWDKYGAQAIVSIKKMDVFQSKTEDEAAEVLLLQKAVTALEHSQAGIPTKYLFQWDFTSSGMIIGGISFHSREMMDLGNIHSGNKVADLYSDFGKAFKLDIVRKLVKKVLMPYLHGSTLKKLVEKIHGVTGKVWSINKVAKNMRAAFGPCADNILDITNWGVGILHNDETEFHFTLPDGFRATHSGYFESIEVKVTCASANPQHELTCKTSHLFIVDMPVNRTSDRQWLVKTPHGPKVRGLYANITHSIDAYVLRHIVDVFLDMDMPVLLKHDAYMIHPCCYQILLEESRKSFDKLFERNLYAEALKEIASYAKSKPPVPVLVRGTARKTISKANAYLIP